MALDSARTEPVGSIAEAIARMRALEAALPPDDGVAAFNRMYLQITESVAEQLGASFFADPVFMDRLDTVFANLYFGAVDAALTHPARVPRAWTALLERRSDRRVTPIQFALAGMNAHINRDLSVALVETCLEFGGGPDQGSRHSDYNRINEILAAAERSVRQSFEPGLILLADQAFAAVKDVIVNWDLRKARANAWTNGETLWALRQASRRLAADYLAGLDRLVGFAGRGLLVPVLWEQDQPVLAGYSNQSGR